MERKENVCNLPALLVNFGFASTVALQVATQFPTIKEMEDEIEEGWLGEGVSRLKFYSADFQLEMWNGLGVGLHKAKKELTESIHKGVQFIKK